MPKVSDYELEHFADEVITTQKFKKKSKQVKEKKYPDKKDRRTNWKEQMEIQESLEDEFIDLDDVD